MTGYTRVETYTSGDTIEASDTNNEFDAIVNAFNNSTGHTHDGTAAEGAPITKIGPTYDIVVSATNALPKTTNVLDLGSDSKKFKDLYINGVAYIGSIDGLTTPNINSFPSSSTTGNISFLKEYISDSNLGGGVFIWNGSKNKTDHDGGTVIDPDVDMTTPTYTSANVGTGVWVRADVGDKINVQWFGAVGDGSTDDSTAIQAALDTFTTRSIYFPDTGSSYVIGTTLTIYEDQTLIGDNFKGGNLSVLKTVASAFSGNAMVQTNGFTTSTATTTNIDNISIIGLSFDVAQSGIDCIRASARFASIKDCRFDSGVAGSTSTALYFIGMSAETALNSDIINNYFTGNTGGNVGFKHHIYLYDKVSDLRILNNYFEGCSHSSIYTRASVLFVVNNHFYNIGRVFFTAYSCDHNFISNYVENTDSAPIFVYRARTDLTSGYTVNLNVSNNTFRDINNQTVAGSTYSSANGLIEVGASDVYPVSGILIANNTNKLEDTAATYGYVIYEYNGAFDPLDDDSKTFVSGYVTDIRIVNNNFDYSIITSGVSNLSVSPILITDDTKGNEQRTAATTNYVYKIINTSTTGDTKCIQLDKGSTTATTSSTWIDFFQNGSSVGGLYNNAGTPALFSTSDARLKENITYSTLGLQSLLAIKVRDFTWKNSGDASTGFIAQELYDAYPKAVTVGGADPAVEPWTITPTALIPLMVKSIQDQQEIINLLASKIEALEAV